MKKINFYPLIKKNFYPFLVFLTGAAILVIEVTATRILAPFYGNTIFTVSSVLGIVLMALSLGYYWGGKLADKYPDNKIFFLMIFCGGISVLIMQICIIIFLPFFAYQLSMIVGPLLMAIFLFFIPALLLGTLSPYAIKLHELSNPELGIGTISGTIFFWSTLGSIIGSLGTGFLLIPNFGVQNIILGVAIVLIVLGAAPLFFFWNQKKKILFFLLLISIIFIAVIILSQMFKPANVVYEADGVYEKILIYDGQYQGRPTRFFRQDGSSSAAMFLDNGKPAYKYAQYYTLYHLFDKRINRALVIGGGAYLIPKMLIEDFPDAQVEVVEIEPELFQLSKEYFDLSDDPRLINHVLDGRRFLYESDKSFDYIYSDVFKTFCSIPTHFTTIEFWELLKKKLSPNGIVLANLIGEMNLSENEKSLFWSQVKTIKTVFPNSYFFAIEGKDETKAQNIIFLGVNGDKVINFNDSKVLQSDVYPLADLSDQLLDVSVRNLSSQLILTDDYAPVDNLIAPLIKRMQWS